MLIQSIRKKILTLVSLMAILGAVGCHHSDDPCPPEEPQPDPEHMTLCLNVTFDGQDDATRADNGPDGYESPVGDFEKISTLRVIIFRALNFDETTGMATSGIVEANRLVATTDAGYPKGDNLEFKVIANEKKRIYLIANEEYLSVPSDFTTSINPTVMKYLESYKVGKEVSFSSLTNWTVSLPNLTSTTTEVTRGLFSAPNPKPGEASLQTRLPLTEFFDVEVNRDENRPNESVYTHLFMTRAAAKARFFLTTSDNFNEGNVVAPIIESITLSGIGTKEYVFPNKTLYSPSKESLISYNPGYKGPVETYITDFQTPEDNGTLSFKISEINEVVKQPLESDIAYLDEAKTKPLGKPIKEAIYFPESIIGNEKYTVTVNLADGTSLSAPLETNILNIAGKGNAIARNTYLPIVIEFVGAMDIRVEVLPWSSEVYEFDFSDHVGMSNDGAVSFIESTYAEDGFDKTTGRLVLGEYPNATRGSFTIGSPVGHRWDAYLITTQGEMNAIQFVTGKDAEGNNIFSDHITGIVGDKVDFNVAATMSAGNQQREAILQVMVSLDYGGISVPVNILEGGSYGEGTENITFIQNAR